jgi:hypothetical protein
MNLHNYVVVISVSRFDMPSRWGGTDEDLRLFAELLTAEIGTEVRVEWFSRNLSLISDDAWNKCFAQLPVRDSVEYRDHEWHAKIIRDKIKSGLFGYRSRFVLRDFGAEVQAYLEQWFGAPPDHDFDTHFDDFERCFEPFGTGCYPGDGRDMGLPVW